MTSTRFPANEYSKQLSEDQYPQYSQYTKIYTGMSEESEWRLKPEQFRDHTLSFTQAATLNACEGAIAYLSNATGINARPDEESRRVYKEKDSERIERLHEWLKHVPDIERAMPMSELAIPASKDIFEVEKKQNIHKREGIETSTGYQEVKNWALNHSPNELVAAADQVLAGRNPREVMGLPAIDPHDFDYREAVNPARTRDEATVTRS